MADSEDVGSRSDKLAVTTETIANQPETLGGETLGMTLTAHTLAVGGHDTPAEPARGASEPPAVIGKYRIERKLGAGGMGVVYLGRDLDLDRPVAIKLLGAGLTRGQSLARAQARMRREARAMARLGHPHVVRVYEVGAAAGQLFVAMEYIEGETLDGWLASDERSWADIAAIFVQAGEGLLAAHDVGIVHRDFKPQNVLVEADKGASQLVGVRARVLDFGLAGLGEALEGQDEDDGDLFELDEAGPETLAETLARLTMTGSLLGTPAYMAPEQFIGTAVDHRADQFAFCVALYEALYGQRPFTGDTLPLLRQAVLAGELRTPPVTSEAPGWLRDLVIRGLAADPDQRWASMRELLVALTAELDTAIADELTHSVGRETRARVFMLLSISVVAVAAPILLVISQNLAKGIVVVSHVGAISLFVVLGLMFVLRRTMLSSPYNRRSAALIVTLLSGALANVMTARYAELPITVVDRFNLVLLGSLGLLAAVSLDRAMVVVVVLAVVATVASYAMPVLGGLGFVIGVALICLVIGIGGSRRRRGSATISVSLRGSAAESKSST